MLGVVGVLGVLGPLPVDRMMVRCGDLCVAAGRLRCLVLQVLGRHAGFRHDITALTEQAFVDRQMFVSAGFGCHFLRTSIRWREPLEEIWSDAAEPHRDAMSDGQINQRRKTEIEENAQAFCVHGENIL
ncbi:hypothetical protein C7821_104172 [Streptomyces sp. VMFN-G11Ma]|nr:hypothetical protein C7821_104172 [Streptomyces sp. VMFN-G11Ma]